MKILYHHRIASKDGQFVLLEELTNALVETGHELLEFAYSLIVAYKLIIAVVKFRPGFMCEQYNLYQPVGVTNSRLFKMPFLIEVNAPLVQERFKYGVRAFPRIAKIIENFTWRNASYILPVTQVLAEHSVAAGVSRQKIVEIPNGVNQTLQGQLDKK